MTCPDIAKSLQNMYGSLDDVNLANFINETFLSPMSIFAPLPANYSTCFADDDPTQALVVSKESVYKKLIKLNENKAHGPDNIPEWLLKENADILAEPISNILNCSYQEGRLPSSWKEADVTFLCPNKDPWKT